MSLEISISPGGRLCVGRMPDILPEVNEKWIARLTEAFDTSAADGLLLLATDALTLQLPPSPSYWRDFSRLYLQRLCHTGNAEAGPALVLPAARAEMAEFTLQAPPMRGGEFLVPELLETRHAIQEQLRDRVLHNLRELDAQLGMVKMTTRLALDAGWYAVLRIPASRSDEEVAIALLEQESVLIHPGHFFDFPGAGYLIASLIAPEEDFREGFGRVLRAIDRNLLKL